MCLDSEDPGQYRKYKEDIEEKVGVAAGVVPGQDDEYGAK